MIRLPWKVDIGIGCLLGTLLAVQGFAQQDQESLSNRVEKIFVSRCFECHSGENVESDFRLDDSRKRLLGGGDSEEPAVVPGDLDRGSLLRWITSKDETERMPPDGERLTQNQIDAIRVWIAKGAKIEGAFKKTDSLLWSFRPILKKFPQSRRNSDRVFNQVDEFVTRRLEQAGLKLNALESRQTLIRRLYLVTLGLPPSPDEVDEFVRDLSPYAYEKLVDRVMASSAFGERWAQHWLDIIRFGETHGFETNRERPNAWHFRDYVVESLNTDKPYDRFVREQIAGDQLKAPVATGFIVAGPHDIVKSPDINLTLMQRQDELADIVNVAGTTFLGLTVGCARCHDHKFDPISQKDFYSLQAVFAGVQHADRSLAASPNAAALVSELDKEISDLKNKLEPFERGETLAMIAIDDADQVDGNGKKGIRYHLAPKGIGKNPAGSGRGFRDDSGSEVHSPNVSGGQYTWWENTPGKTVATFQPVQKGRFRIWISWGSGQKTHSTDAEYLLDQDGDLSSKADQKVLATVNQVDFNDQSPAKLGYSLWSGFLSVGVHELKRSSVVVLRGGKNGSAVTADVMLFERIDSEAVVKNKPSQPPIRSRVNSRHNVEHLFPVQAKYLRFSIESSSQSQPCIDELEVFAGGQNIALASKGTVATSNGDFVHPLHKLKHINDGLYGNPKSWIAKNNTGWVQLTFPEVATIDRVEWGRDRNGNLSDRVAFQYRIEVAIKPGQWQEVSSSRDRLPFRSKSGSPPRYEFSKFSTEKASIGNKWFARLMRAEQQRNAIAKPVQVYAGTFGKPATTHRLYRGDPFQKREPVEPNTISALGDLELGLNEVESKRRVDFANWLTRPENPLLARVIVNRLWQHTFGRGIVATPNDFGNSGHQPSHPMLLDWLASELIRSDWSLKHVQRQILLSHTFRQSSRSSETGQSKDASCRLLWRFPPRRLEAESIRDSILTVSGTLDRRIGGPGFSGFEVAMENVRHFFPKEKFGPSDWRRMIYMTKVRQERDAVFGAFDCPDASQIISRRSRSTTPLQSLNLLNSKFVLEQATKLAGRIKRESEDMDVSPVMLAYRLLFLRNASQLEIEEGEGFISSFGLSAFCRALLNANEFIFIQ